MGHDVLLCLRTVYVHCVDIINLTSDSGPPPVFRAFISGVKREPGDEVKVPQWQIICLAVFLSDHAVIISN